MSLALEYKDLLAEVGLFLGFGRGADFDDPEWDARTEATIVSVVKSGLRQFYFPPPVEGTPSAYVWSFLQPTAQLSLLEGAQTVDLPDDFGGAEGDVTIATTTQSFASVPIVGEGMVRQQYASTPTTTGRPIMCAIESLRGTGGRHGQKFRLFVFPEADDDYTLELAYYLIPDALTNPFPHPYGGAQHAETILESCLAIAEERVDDAGSTHKQKFTERLLASISADRKNKAQTLGYNRDLSDGGRWYTRREIQYGNRITVGGVLY